MKVLVTGANGFIGSHIVRAFHKSRRAEVLALVRARADLKFIDQYKPQIIRGDFSGDAPLPDAVKSADAIIHVGAKVGDWGDYRDFFKANVLGSLKLFDSTSPDSLFIFVSSNAVMGEEDNPNPKDEKAPYRPVLDYFLETSMGSGMNHYRLTKALAEMFLVNRAKKTGRRLTVVRPVWVYGPREFHAGPYEYCKTVKDGLPFMPGSDKNRFHTIYAGDLARIIQTITENLRPGVNIYNVGNPEVPLMADYWGSFCDAMGKGRPMHLPKALLYPPALLLEAAYTAFGSPQPPLFTRARVYMFYANNVYDVKKVINEYNITWFTPLERATRLTVRWWRQNGYL